MPIVLFTLTLSISATNARDYSSWMAELPVPSGGIFIEYRGGRLSSDTYLSFLSILGSDICQNAVNGVTLSCQSMYFQ